MIQVAKSGAHFPLKENLLQQEGEQPAPPFRQKYLANKPEVHTAFANEQMKGWAVILNQEAAEALKGQIQLTPLSWEPKATDPLGRVIVDATAVNSNGLSLNESSDKTKIEELYGKINYPSVVDAAAKIRQLHRDDPTRNVLISVERRYKQRFSKN